MSDDASGENAADTAHAGRDREQDAQIFRRREDGASWLEIQRELGLTRQQARYGYQRAKREERRAARRRA